MLIFILYLKMMVKFTEQRLICGIVVLEIHIKYNGLTYFFLLIKKRISFGDFCAVKCQ